jgi:hypothetical protein
MNKVYFEQVHALHYILIISSQCPTFRNSLVNFIVLFSFVCVWVSVCVCSTLCFHPLTYFPITLPLLHSCLIIIIIIIITILYLGPQMVRTCDIWPLSLTYVVQHNDLQIHSFA